MSCPGEDSSDTRLKTVALGFLEGCGIDIGRLGIEEGHLAMCLSSPVWKDFITMAIVNLCFII